MRRDVCMPAPSWTRQTCRFVLLSELCIPLFNFSFTYNYLMSSPFSFLRMKVEAGALAMGRWNRDFLPVVARSSWRKGANGWPSPREAAKLVISDTTYYPEFRGSLQAKEGSLCR